VEEIRTFGDILAEIIDLAKLQDTEEVRNSLKRKVNTCYQELCFEEPYRWTGETRPLVLKASYSDGYVSVTEGSDQVIGSSTAWTEIDHLDCKIKIAGAASPYRIIRVDETGQTLTLDAPWVKDNSALVSYSIYKDEYGLFPDLQDIRTMEIPGVGMQRQPMPCGVMEMDSLRGRFPFRSGLPYRYTINGFAHYHAVTWDTFRIGFDFWEDDPDLTPRNKKLMVYPAIFTQDKIAIVRYTRTVSSMNEDSEEPLIPYENRAVLVYATLVRHFLKNRDPQTAIAWKQEFVGLKTKMAAHIETTDDELVVSVDHRDTGFEASMASDLTTAPWDR
jgi:hypothetical protein